MSGRKEVKGKSTEKESELESGWRGVNVYEIKLGTRPNSIITLVANTEY
jgi:hypothetical protein